ncbi:MAG: hypothetical protein ACPHL6_07375 [Rubripirellula sp.]
MMGSPLIKIDDKHLPLHRIVWVSDVPHFCGEDDCMHEGEYEVRLDIDDSVWANRSERDYVIESMNQWYGGDSPDETGSGWA